EATRALPSPRVLVSWLFAARLALAVGVLLWAALLWAEAPDLSLGVSAGVLLAFTVTAYGSWVVLVKGAEPAGWFLRIQAVVDLGLVALLVHFGGGSGSVFPALFVVTIAVYAVLLPFGAGLLVALLAAVLHLADAFLWQPGPPTVAVWGQVTVFLVVFTVVALLGQRLRQATQEQATLQSELRRVRLEADDILRNIHSGILTVDGKGRLAFLNATGAQLLGIDPDAGLGQPVLDQVKSRCSELWAALAAGIRSGRRVNRGEGTILDGDRVVEIGLTTTVFEPEPGQPPSVTALFTDISESKQFQELRLRAERLEAVASLSASLAHEIKNPLASIRSSVEQLARADREDEDEQVLARLIVRESDRLSRILTEFLDFARVRAQEYTTVDLHELASAAARLMREHPDCREDVDISVTGDRLLMDGDDDLLHRVVGNLVLNAAQAARGPTSIRVEVAPARNGEAAGLGPAARLRVQDDGPGIPAEIRDRLFEPFVTGRPGGTGLGLAVVQRAVEAHRGLLLVDSAPGRGTTFTVYFPVKWSAG
ncbi:MAG TPA: ATP-binding protein, partial [Gemmatimonadales bacterium]|nr:ATP-binding protein [Gemmatimonadales bacterium]